MLQSCSHHCCRFHMAIHMQKLIWAIAFKSIAFLVLTEEVLIELPVALFVFYNNKYLKTNYLIAYMKSL